jgi:arylsulfatase A-like enzyme
MEWLNPKIATAITDFPLEDYSTGLIASQAEQYLRSAGSDPFLLWISFPDPHEPYETPRRYADLIPPDSVTLPPWDPESFEATAPERNRVLHEMLGVDEDAIGDLIQAVRVYYANVRFIDDAVGRIVDTIEELGMRENTLVVFCADHGDFAGERRMMVKGGVFYDCLTRIPLILSMPATVPRRVRENGMANLIDVVPTVFGVLGIPIPGWMQGRPLPPATDGRRVDAVFSEYGAGGPRFTMADLSKADRPYGYRTLINSLQWREAAGRRKMVRTNDWKFVHDPMGDADELYHLSEDPWELRNLAGDPAYRDIICAMFGRLADFSISTEDSVPVPLPSSYPSGL